MPIIDISIRRGRETEQLNELMRAIHEATKAVLQTADGNIRVIVREVEAEHWMSGGRTLAEIAAAAQTGS